MSTSNLEVRSWAIEPVWDPGAPGLGLVTWLSQHASPRTLYFSILNHNAVKYNISECHVGLYYATVGVWGAGLPRASCLNFDRTVHIECLCISLNSKSDVLTFNLISGIFIVDLYTNMPVKRPCIFHLHVIIKVSQTTQQHINALVSFIVFGICKC